MKKALVLFFFSLTTWMFAQTPAGLHGKVADAATGETLAGASISVQGLGTFTTDFDGYFDLTSLQPGTYKVVCQYLSYSNKTLEIEVKAGETLSLQINMEEPAIDITKGVSAASVSPATATSSMKSTN
ncbi:MAG: hypothetical protein K0S33_270 [Bacteroidetes bacterium]|jgi:hypothetical protein|nr:hypothetical protein [Bacteroidota bacterium]